jgi:hypothetical protein
MRFAVLSLTALTGLNSLCPVVNLDWSIWRPVCSVLLGVEAPRIIWSSAPIQADQICESGAF